MVKENHELSKKLELATGKGASVGGDKGGASPTSFEGSTLTFDEAENGFERVSMSPNRGKLLALIHSYLEMD